MNEKQIYWLRIGIILIVFMGFFPPTRPDYRPDVTKYQGHRQTLRPLRFTPELPELYGYTFLLCAKASDIAFKRLIIQWVIVGAVIFALICTFRGEEQKDEQEE